MLVDPSGKIIRNQKGGPALFIEQAIRSEGLPYRLLAGDRVNVEILVTPTGEYGRVAVPPTEYFAQTDALTEWTIVSTILDEWNLTDLQVLPARLFIDIQGYVRKPGDFGQKQFWGGLPKLADQIFCLKGTAEEIKCLPRPVIEDQKTRLLIVTYGDEGADIFYEGRRSRIKANKIAGLDNTIGAGDTFLAYTAASMYRGSPPEAAATYAAQKTAQFLQQKLKDRSAS
ncbi:MAG TPA: PfkB family carbohydrate kinase [Candidatus Saccharimonadales bacterium]|nr:PfkB family carbohydrate kinase [Candidatus Saccharimonadales bacterium]